MSRWRDQAACLTEDSDLFYPETPRDLERARAICHGCPVRAECVRDALRRGDEWGVHGGLVPGEYLPLPAAIGGDDLAAVLAKADETAAPVGNRRVRPLIAELVHVLAEAARQAPPGAIPPDPEAALHREILLRELDAYDAAHRSGERPSARRRAAVGPRPGRPPGRPPSVTQLADLRQAHREAERHRVAGRTVPGPVGELEREYYRLMKQAQRGGTGRAA